MTEISGGTIVLVLIAFGFLFFFLRDIFGWNDPAVANSKRLAREAKAAKLDDTDSGTLQHPKQTDPYELAMAELVSEEIDNAVWAKAFAMSENDEATRRMYVQLRAESLQSDASKAKRDSPKVTSEKPTSPITAKLFAMMVCASAFGMLLVGVFYDPLNETLITRLTHTVSGRLWLLFVLLPFAAGYLLWKRRQ